MMFKANIQAVKSPGGRHQGFFREADVIFYARNLDDAEEMITEWVKDAFILTAQKVDVNSVYQIGG